ncbi:LexA family transcriptional regulator [Avibacterium paragallinarum]|uniref:Helix-turn-helix domain-containing protein n=1 Tax=Avibacterium paragallinarum TaxID=728 RepID=A0A8B3T864_AVIPA|nr:S24 family peptidase [Avibacterium paragallinarum]RZN55758.1 helix-turn-helix domain-containing protein [Avibacterium paragallinarum]
MTLGEKIKTYREQLGLSQKELAEKCSVLDQDGKPWGQPRIANYEKGNRTPNLDDIEIIAKALNITPQSLAFDNNVTFTHVIKSYQYPLLSTIQAGMWCDINYLDNIDSDEQFEMVASQVKASDRAFFLVINGESMLSRFKEGDLVLIDPNLAPTPGKFVAAINEDNEATFKQYKQLASYDEHGRPHFNLVPLNDSFPTLSSKEHNITIIGVAVEHRQVL